MSRQILLGKRDQRPIITIMQVKDSGKGYSLKFNTLEQLKYFQEVCDISDTVKYFSEVNFVENENGTHSLNISFQTIKPESLLDNTPWCRLYFSKNAETAYVQKIYESLLMQVNEIRDGLRQKGPQL